MTYIHILVYVSTLTGLLVHMVLTELMHNHVCETVNILTGLMHTMYIYDNIYMYIHGTNTISDTEIGKGVAPGYHQLSRQRVCVRGGGGGGERGGERLQVAQCMAQLYNMFCLTHGKIYRWLRVVHGIHKWL